MNSAATVYIVDDEAQVCTGLSRLVRSAGLQAQTFTDGREFLANPPGDGLGCILLDVDMPGMSGPELHVRLGDLALNLPVIYLTGVGNVPLSVEAMKRGAQDFLEKPVDAEQLLAAIDKAIATHRQRSAHDGHLSELKTRVDLLSAREREVMGHVIGGRLNKQIAYDLGIAEKTVKVHRGRVMTKIGARSLAQLVHICDELGIQPTPGADKG
ncbi:MAG TPA: response regulator [Xanthomonadales bacterium]|nr:response regulator [Xanthomonadales bacterium]